MTVSLIGLLLVLGSAAAYSGVDLTRKLLVARMRGAVLLFYLSIGQAPFFLLWAWFSGALSVGPGYLAPAGASVVLNIAANLLFMEAVRISPLSLTVPFLALTPVFTALLGIPLLGEVPGTVELIGVVVVVAGAFQLNAGSAGIRLRTPLAALLGEPGSRLMVLVALCWSLAMPFDKLALAHADVSVHGFVLSAGVALGALALLLLRWSSFSLHVHSRDWQVLGVSVVISVFGLALLLMSLAYLWVAVAETVRRAFGSVAALIVGRWVFQEPITTAKVVGVALMSAGVAMILL